MNDNVKRPFNALPPDGTTECWYHYKPRKSFYKYKKGCFSPDDVEWWRKEDKQNG